MQLILDPTERDKALARLDRLLHEVDLIDPRCNWEKHDQECNHRELRAREIRTELMNEAGQLEVRLGF
jgi:hypothetical protein